MEPKRNQHQPEDAWESLPIDFLIKILRDHYLPTSTLMECRLVCKKWKEVIDVPQLSNRIWKNSVIVFYAHRENTAHFCCRDQWITRSLTFVPKKLVAADGGLLCFGERFSRAYVMYNPVPDKILFLDVPLEINGEQTVIDGQLKIKVVGLVVDQSTKNFKLVLGGVQVATDRRRTLIYDSTTGTWSWGIHPFPECLIAKWDCRRSVVCNRCLYWLVWDHYWLLLIFDLEDGTWNALVGESMEATRFDLKMAAYERHVCLLPSNWSALKGEFDRRSDVANFVRNPMVRRTDGALIRRVRNLYDRALVRRQRNMPWNMQHGRDEAFIRRIIKKWFLAYPTVFKFYATGGSDAFFVFDEEHIDLEVVKYCAELDSIFFLRRPPFESRNRVQYFVLQPIDDPWCAIIPSPIGSAGQGWITQQDYVAQQQRREDEDAGSS